jgi:hypothetical protein
MLLSVKKIQILCISVETELIRTESNFSGDVGLIVWKWLVRGMPMKTGPPCPHNLTDHREVFILPLFIRDFSKKVFAVVVCSVLVYFNT